MVTFSLTKKSPFSHRRADRHHRRHCQNSSMHLDPSGGAKGSGSGIGCCKKSKAQVSPAQCNNNANNKSGTAFRRKSIPEKWLIPITLLAASILLDSAYGQMMCYECVWQGSTPLPSTRDGVSDVCRPPNFNVDIVHKIKCTNGCMTQALYELSDPPRQASGNNAASNATGSNRTMSIENMTFFMRGCQDKKTRGGCEKKSFAGQVATEECVCLTDYCNGESNGAASLSTLLAFFGGGSGSGWRTPRDSQTHRSNNRKSAFFFVDSYWFTMMEKWVLLVASKKSFVEFGAIALFLNFSISKMFSIASTTSNTIGAQ